MGLRQEFSGYVNNNIFSNHQTAGFPHQFGHQAKVFTTDLCITNESNSRIPPGIINNALKNYIKGYRPGDIANGKFTFNSQMASGFGFSTCAMIGHCWKILHIQELCTTEVFIAFLCGRYWGFLQLCLRSG